MVERYDVHGERERSLDGIYDVLRVERVMERRMPTRHGPLLLFEGPRPLDDIERQAAVRGIVQESDQVRVDAHEALRVIEHQFLRRFSRAMKRSSALFCQTSIRSWISAVSVCAWDATLLMARLIRSSMPSLVSRSRSISFPRFETSCARAA